METFFYIVCCWVFLGVLGHLANKVNGLNDLTYDDYDDDDPGPSPFAINCAMGPITLGFAIVYSWQLSKETKEAEAEEIKRKENAQKTKDDAISKYPSLLNSLKIKYEEIQSDNSKLSKKYFDEIKKILDYCTRLKIDEIPDKGELKIILIYARMNVLEFFENNDLKNAENLSKKITKILKKIK